MRKRIAVFSGGWSGEFLQNILSGITNTFKAVNIDVFAFVNFSIHTDNEQFNIPEIAIYKLPNLKDFDGAILLANSFNDEREEAYLKSAIQKAGIPAITTEMKIGDFPMIATDNYTGMHDLVSHLIIEHQAKDLVFVGGPANHPESAERQKAFIDAIEERGMKVPDNNIYHGDWSKTLLPSIFEEYFATHNNRLPDAFVFANDIMAMAACIYLKEKGFSIPYDVIVTGYDCTRLARTHSPSIATVSHEWGLMGELTAKRMLALLKGDTIPSVSTLSTIFVPGQSCGCDDISITLAERRVFAMYDQDSRIDPIDADSHFRHFYTNIRKAASIQTVHDSYSYLFEHEHDVEGPDFMLCLDPAFFDVDEDRSDLTRGSYKDEFIAICKLEGGYAQPHTVYPRETVLFQSSNYKAEAGLYVFMPLYSEGYMYGFAMLNGKLNIVNENQHYIWSRHMIQSLEIVNNNLLLADMHAKLMKLSVTDTLTEIYNRAGCEKYIYPKLIDWAKNNKYSVLMLVDVDRMKMINDKYGHISGDQALTVVSKVLKEKLPKGFSVSRFGGDEFLIGGIINDSGENMDSLVSFLEYCVSVECQAQNITFPLSISIGYAIFLANDISDIEKAIVVADDDMYLKKKSHHESLDASSNK